MSPRKTTRRQTAKKCPSCKGTGEITESVRVGRARKGQETADRQTALCLACLGSGQAPTG
ncbi:hypothetical protein AB0A70_06470 [Streptomyces morookaense]|uniref:hypothetical protein n=1 Tax=Streptomyces morookaense TaxID=1970 RepID=UPI00340610C9